MTPFINFKRAFIAIAIMLTISISASAHLFKVNGIYYNITSSTDKTCAVTYQGSNYVEYSYEYSGDIVIPESVTYNGITYSVTSIGDDAFRECSGMTSITIPNSVTSIGNYAFYGCSGLTSVTIPNSVTSIGDYAFYKCSNLTSVNISDIEAWCKIRFSNYYSNPLYYANNLYLNGELLTNIEIPNSITEIKYYTFQGCSGLTSVTIPESVTSIDESAFEGCSGLTSVTIPDGVKSIGERAFYGCSGLTSVTIPNSVTSIGESAFEGCSGLTSVTIPNSVTSIGDYAFYKCSGLTSVTIPNSVTSIGGSAFSGCSGLTGVTIPNSVTSIGKSAFSGCSGLTSVTIPESVTSIGGSAFSGCSGLTSVSIGNSVTSIGGGAFEGCSGLTSVTIPNSVISIGDYAFYKCSGLTKITIPSSVISIGIEAFQECSSLTSVTIPNSVTSIGWCAFYKCSGLESIIVESGNTKYDSRDNCNAIIETSTNTLIAGCKNTLIPEGVTSIGGCAFSNCSSLISVTIPNSVTSIEKSAFFGCSGLTSVTIPNSVTSIGEAAFYYCSGLTSVNIPNSVTSIGDRAFYNTGWYNNQPDGILYLDNCCLGYKGDKPTGELSLKYNTRLIAGFAFFGCSGLTSVTIPNSVTSIGEAAFYYCSGLTNIECKAKNPPTLGSGYYRVFSNYSASLMVPIGSYNKYKETEVWNKFNIIDKYLIDNIYYSLSKESKITVVFKDTNYNSYSGEIVIPSEIVVYDVKYKVTQIGEKAFYKCSGLTSITIPNSVTSIGSSAFEYCSGLTKVEIKELDSWCKIDFGNEAANPLYYAGKLYMDSTLVTDISIENIEEIKPYAFYNLTTLMSLTIDENVSKIGDKAFYGNKNIRSITCKASTPPTCGTDVFNSVKTEAVPLTVPQESVSLYQVADTWMDFWNITGSDFSGIDETLFDDTEGAEYYNLQGVKVVNPSSGIYIKKQGNKVTKVVL